MTERNERTTPRIAKIAAKYLAMSPDRFYAHMINTAPDSMRRDIRAMAASCLTQSPDKQMYDMTAVALAAMKAAGVKNAKRKLKPKRKLGRRKP